MTHSTFHFSTLPVIQYYRKQGKYSIIDLLKDITKNLSTLLIKLIKWGLRAEIQHCWGGETNKKTFCPLGDIALFIVSVFVLWQIHAKLKNVTSGVKVSWVAANGQVFHKEKKDEWKQSDRFEC